jgi:hypothetical protein
MQIKSKMKTKSSSRKRRTLVETITAKTRVFLENEKRVHLLQKKHDVIYHLFQQTKQTNKLRKLKQLTLQEKHIVHEAIKI